MVTEQSKYLNYFISSSQVMRVYSPTSYMGFSSRCCGLRGPGVLHHSCDVLIVLSLSYLGPPHRALIPSLDSSVWTAGLDAASLGKS